MVKKYGSQRLDVSNPYMAEVMDNLMKAEKAKGHKPVGEQVIGMEHVTHANDLNEMLQQRGYGNKHHIVPVVCIIPVKDPLLNNKVWKSSAHTDYIITVYDPQNIDEGTHKRFDIEGAGKQVERGKLDQTKGGLKNSRFSDAAASNVLPHANLETPGLNR